MFGCDPVKFGIDAPLVFGEPVRISNGVDKSERDRSERYKRHRAQRDDGNQAQRLCGKYRQARADRIQRQQWRE